MRWVPFVIALLVGLFVGCIPAMALLQYGKSLADESRKPEDTVMVMVFPEALPAGHRIREIDLVAVEIPPRFLDEGVFLEPWVLVDQVTTEPVLANEFVRAERVRMPTGDAVWERMKRAKEALMLCRNSEFGSRVERCTEARTAVEQAVGPPEVARSLEAWVDHAPLRHRLVRAGRDFVPMRPYDELSKWSRVSAVQSLDQSLGCASVVEHTDEELRALVLAWAPPDVETEVIEDLLQNAHWRDCTGIDPITAEEVRQLWPNPGE